MGEAKPPKHTKNRGRFNLNNKKKRKIRGLNGHWPRKKTYKNPDPGLLRSTEPFFRLRSIQVRFSLTLIPLNVRIVFVGLRHHLSLPYCFLALVERFDLSVSLPRKRGNSIRIRTVFCVVLNGESTKSRGRIIEWAVELFLESLRSYFVVPIGNPRELGFTCNFLFHILFRSPLCL